MSVDPRLNRVLVVDDVEVNRDLFRLHLEGVALLVDEAADGFAALELFKQHRYDAVLLDIEMPVLDGYGAMAGMREWEQAQALPGTLILAVTSSDFPGDAQRILDFGASACLAKPLKRKELMKVLALCQPDGHGETSPCPLANLFPSVFAHADAMLDELESCVDPDVASKKLHQLRGMMAVYGFVEFSEHLRQIHAMMPNRKEVLDQAVFDRLRHELQELTNVAR